MTTNIKAFQAFMARKRQADELLERLSDRAAEFFCLDIDNIGWQEVGDLGLIIEHLESALEAATPEELDLAG